MEEKYILFYVLALIAEIIGTVSGFGSSILFVPIASLFFDFDNVLGITALFHVFSNLSKIALFRKGIDKHITLRLGIPAVLFVILGAMLTKFVPQKLLEMIMSIILMLMAVFLMIYSNKQLAQTNTNLITGGVLSGFFAGLIGTGGAIRGITLSAFQLEKDIFIATSALIDFGVDTSRAVVYYFNGYILQEFFLMLPFLIGISITGTWIGKLILKVISQELFQYIVLLTVIITSGVYIIRYFS